MFLLPSTSDDMCSIFVYKNTYNYICFSLWITQYRSDFVSWKWRKRQKENQRKYSADTGAQEISPLDWFVFQIVSLIDSKSVYGDQQYEAPWPRCTASLERSWFNTGWSNTMTRLSKLEMCQILFRSDHYYSLIIWEIMPEWSFLAMHSRAPTLLWLSQGAGAAARVPVLTKLPPAKHTAHSQLTARKGVQKIRVLTFPFFQWFYRHI